MTSPSPVVHSTFKVERTYPFPPARVFAAFVDPAIKRRWFVESEGFTVDEYTLDFRVGGLEQARFQFEGNASVPAAPMRNDTVYMDIVPERRIVFAYTMTMNDHRFSASLATMELLPASAGTRLTFTEQAAFFEGADGAEQREGGWRELLERLGEELAKKS